MPQWLLKNEKYEPLKDKDSFIDKSILSILSVISKLKLKSENKSTINVNIKVLSAIVIIILAATSRSMLYILTIDIALFLVVSLFSIEQIKSILCTSFIVALFTTIILLPSIYIGNVNNSLLIILKVLATITTVNILSHVTEWHRIMGTLKVIFIPDIFIFVLDITIRYIFILGELSVNMLYALKLRTVGQSNEKYNSVTGIVGSMFIRSKMMAEEMHSAMECRGFTGEYRANNEFKLGIKECICLSIDMLLILMYILFK